MEFCDTHCFTNTYKIILVSYFNIDNFIPVKYEKSSFWGPIKVFLKVKDK